MRYNSSNGSSIRDDGGGGNGDGRMKGAQAVSNTDCTLRGRRKSAAGENRDRENKGAEEGGEGEESKGRPVVDGGRERNADKRVCKASA